MCPAQANAAPGPAPTPEAVSLDHLAGLDLNLLVPLLALLEEESVTAAARRVGMTQPALSHALRRMRRILGDDVLVRDGGAMRPTPRARALITPLRATLRATADLIRPTGFDPRSDARTVTVAMSASSAAVLAGELARVIAERAPRIVLRIVTFPLSAPSDAVFTSEDVDVLLLNQAFATAYPRQRLYDDHWVAITAIEAPRLHVLGLLEALPHVVFDAAPYRARPYESLDALGIPYVVRARISDNILIPQVVARSGAIAFHRRQVATAFSASLGLAVHELPFPVAPIGIDLVWNPWTADAALRAWLGEVLQVAAIATGHQLDHPAENA